MELRTIKDKHEDVSDGIKCRIKLLETAFKAIDEVVVEDIHEDRYDNINKQLKPQKYSKKRVFEQPNSVNDIHDKDNLLHL